MIVLDPAASLEVVQVALPLALMVLSGQSAFELPLILNVTVPLGTTGVRATPASWAVNVTAVLTLVGLTGTAVTLRVAVSALTTCAAVFETLML